MVLGKPMSGVSRAIHLSPVLHCTEIPPLLVLLLGCYFWKRASGNYDEYSPFQSIIIDVFSQQ